MEEPVIHYESIRIGETDVELDANSVVVFVGPNNVGKTTAILEIEHELTQQNLNRSGMPNKVIKQVRTSHLADRNEEAARTWVAKFIDERPVLDDPNPEVRSMRNWQASTRMTPDQMVDALKSGSHRAHLSSFLMSRGDTAEFEGSAPNFFEEQHSSGNLQFERLYNNEPIVSELSQLSKDVFGTGLTLSRSGSRSIMLYGDDLGLTDQPVSAEDRAKLRNAPRVSGQGQGVVTLIKLAMTLTLGNEPIVFLDEPEAHLHPPQARKAGKYIADRAKKSQVFITTHSVELILGLLESRETNITLIRLDRDGSLTKPAVLRGEDLVNAWKNPVVKYSRALSGLMHKGVVLCESDGDCLYYQAALEHAREAEGLPSHDLLFIPSAGKQGLKSLVPALKKLAVPICVIADFDIIRTKNELIHLLSSLNDSSNLSDEDWNSVNGKLIGELDPRTINAVAAEISSVLSVSNGTDRYNRDVSGRLKDIIKTQDGWSAAKDLGVNRLRGAPLNAANRIIEAAKESGLMIVPFGQLESFHPEAPANHGPKWVEHVMENELYKSLSGNQLAFIKDIPSNTK